MKLAQVTYSGRFRHTSHTPPSGNRYVFQKGDRTRFTQSEPVPIEDLEDARYFEERADFDVTWTSLGKAIRRAGGPTSAIGEMLESMKYQEKQSLAATLGVGGSGPEKELDERLKPAIEELQEGVEVRK